MWVPGHILEVSGSVDDGVQSHGGLPGHYLDPSYFFNATWADIRRIGEANTSAVPLIRPPDSPELIYFGWFDYSLEARNESEWIAEDVAAGITGALNATETGSDTFSGSGALRIQGALATVESGQDVFVGGGDVFIGGVLSATETGADTFGADGVVGQVNTEASGGIAPFSFENRRRKRRQEEQAREELEEKLRQEAQRQAEDALAEFEAQERQRYLKRLDELLRMQPAPLAVDAKEIAGIAADAVQALYAELAAEFDRYIVLLEQERDEEDAVMALLLAA